MTADAARIAELEKLWREFSEECIGLQKDVQRVEAGRKVVLRALVEARDALRGRRRQDGAADH